jgi:MFS transporter, CP family, cyanate transporter
MKAAAQTTATRLPTWVTLLGVVLVALNLRAAIAAVSPLLPQLSADLGLSRGAGGLLTTLPVLCFGGLSAASAALGRRIGSEWALMIGMLAIVVGSAIRFVPSVPWVFAGTLVIGAAVAIGNVLVPSVIKQHFPDRSGTVTGLYTAVLIAGAAIAAAISAPLADVGLGWRGGLLVWAIPALLAAIAWLPSLRHTHRPPDSAFRARTVLRSPVTWSLAIFMGTQSLLYFAVLAWLPALLQNAGVSSGAAGLALSLFNVLGIVSALVIPNLAARWNQHALGMSICAGWAIGIVGLLAAPRLYLAWMFFAGLAQGAAISFVFALIVLRSRTPDVARGLSGTVQTIGYVIGAAGPFVMGALRDSTAGWTAPLLVLVGVIVVMSTAALGAGRQSTVG